MVEVAEKISIAIPNVKDCLNFDVNAIRNDFPILQQKFRGKKLKYLDNAATTQKPRVVIDTITNYYSTQNANIHRGVYQLSEIATQAYEDVRSTVKKHINANSIKEIVFVRGTTEGINLVASSYGRQNISQGDEIIISEMEHHSNIVPWQILCEEKGAKLRIIPMNDSGELLFDAYANLINERTKLIALVYISNSLGTVNPVMDFIRLAHEENIPVLLDGAQALPHIKVDMQELDCDFFLFSGHKVFGPTGSGVLYAKESLLEQMVPYQGGGDMILSVKFEGTTYNDIPHKFEAGTPNIAGVIGLGAALEYISQIGYLNIENYEQGLLSYATNAISDIDMVKIIGTAKNKASVISFTIDNVHPHDVGTILDSEGIAIRTGHHCTQPVMDRFNVPATSRASFAFYNTKDEIDDLVSGIQKVIKLFL